MKVAQNEKRKKLHGFSYCKNIANFEAFWRGKNFSKNLLFLGSDVHLITLRVMYFFSRSELPTGTSKDIAPKNTSPSLYSIFPIFY